ncbi:unnamed protein product [Effrenium voratum]|nr:unnamed protein product [Effrenium voratum]
MKYARAHAIPPPWQDEPCFVQKLFVDRCANGKSQFFKLDIWHTIAMGIGKTWCAASVSIIQRHCLGKGSVEQRFARLTADFREYCTRERKSPYVNKLTPEMFNISGDQEPQGMWNKGSLTTTLLLWMEDFLGRHADKIHLDERLQYIASGTRGINNFTRALHEEGCWIKSQQATSIAHAGEHFVKCYSYCAFLSLGKNQNMFQLMPKLHALHESVCQMKRQASIAAWTYNVLTEACPLDEDFIGRLCRVARSVSPRLQARRALERYRVQLMSVWCLDA